MGKDAELMIERIAKDFGNLSFTADVFCFLA